MKRYLITTTALLSIMLVFSSYVYGQDSVGGLVPTEDTTTLTSTDTTPPRIELEGTNPLSLKVGEEYRESGAHAHDNVDGNISEKIHINSSNLDVHTPGKYQVLYTAKDIAGNSAVAVRIVYVLGEELVEQPVLTEAVLIGSTDIKSMEEEMLYTQAQDLLRILREKEVSRIEEIKRERIESARIFLEESALKEDDVVHDVPILETEAVLEEVRAELELELEEIFRIEEKTIEEARDLERIVLRKRQKIIEHAREVQRSARAREEALKDSDKDGISDHDEINIYETDPLVADSDGDGFVDGAEVLGGFDPLDESPDAVVEYESPKEHGDLEDGLFSVGKIEVKGVSVVKNEEEIVNRVHFEGKSLANSFVTLYIFSIPTVVTIKTDDEGNWNYILDKELEDGEHEIYVAMTDNSGKILVKSSPIFFVKEAVAVTIDQNLLSFQPEGVSPGFWSGGYLYMTILLLVFITGITLVFIGMRSGKINEGRDNLV